MVGPAGIGSFGVSGAEDGRLGVGIASESRSIVPPLGVAQGKITTSVMTTEAALLITELATIQVVLNDHAFELADVCFDPASIPAS